MIPIGTDLRATVKYLKAHSLVVVTAESCTAGLIASRLAAAPGAGEVLECAFVVYDPKAKHRCLGVPAEILERNNLTSECAFRYLTVARRSAPFELVVMARSASRPHLR